MGLPPSEDGADQLTVALAVPGTAVTLDGAPGAVAAGAGVTEFEGADEGPEPAPFAAVTLKV